MPLDEYEWEYKRSQKGVDVDDNGMNTEADLKYVDEGIVGERVLDRLEDLLEQDDLSAALKSEQAGLEKAFETYTNTSRNPALVFKRFIGVQTDPDITKHLDDVYQNMFANTAWAKQVEGNVPGLRQSPLAGSASDVKTVPTEHQLAHLEADGLPPVTLKQDAAAAELPPLRAKGKPALPTTAKPKLPEARKIEPQQFRIQGSVEDGAMGLASQSDDFRAAGEGRAGSIAPQLENLRKGQPRLQADGSLTKTGGQGGGSGKGKFGDVVKPAGETDALPLEELRQLEKFEIDVPQPSAVGSKQLTDLEDDLLPQRMPERAQPRSTSLTQQDELGGLGKKVETSPPPKLPERTPLTAPVPRSALNQDAPVPRNVEGIFEQRRRDIIIDTSAKSKRSLDDLDRLNESGSFDKAIKTAQLESSTLLRRAAVVADAIDELKATVIKSKGIQAGKQFDPSKYNKAIKKIIKNIEDTETKNFTRTEFNNIFDEIKTHKSSVMAKPKASVAVTDARNERLVNPMFELEGNQIVCRRRCRQSQ